MEPFIFFTEETRNKHLHPRLGETKFGEELSFLSSLNDLQATKARYVIFGVPEDIGIQANYGKPGAHTTWEAFLASFLNIQVNRYNQPENCVVLGHVNCTEFKKEAQNILAESPVKREKLGAIVEKIDTVVSHVVARIVAAGKIPIIIGGGHNNAFGNIKGTAEGLGRMINVLNIDAHTDLRHTDYRHSGNGFSYAQERGFMEHYAMFGIHKNYTPEYIYKNIAQNPQISLLYYEDLLALSTTELIAVFKETCKSLSPQFGLEIDCDSIAHFSASAQTPSGFSIDSIRTLLTHASKENIHYLHLAEAADAGTGQIGKALSYFVSDFIRKS